jgi:hypothetical protein
MLDITRMLTEKRFRDDVISYLDDPVVKNFWVTEFASWNEKFASEAVAPVLNKVGAFTANPLVRNIIGQPKGGFNIRQAMDEGKILIVNLSKGRIGEDNAAILGAMLVTKIQLAAMSRADIPRLEDRKPFYLYVDEFQNFATDSFAVILSEARKYGLNLTIANQYISQMEETVRSAVFGNVGSMVTFRVSPDDSPFLTKYYEPQFEAADLSNFHNRLFVASLSVNGEKTTAFSGGTLNIPQVQNDLTPQIVAHSRELYAADKKYVEDAIRLATEPMKPVMPPGGSTNGRVSYAASTHNAPIKPSIVHGAGAAVLHAATEAVESASAKRRKRRKRAAEAAQVSEEPSLSPAPQPQNSPQSPQAQKASPNDETVVHLR